MQETPNFESQRQRFTNLSRHSVLDSREKVTGADRSYLETVFYKLELYFNDANFRATLPLSLRQSIEQYFENILGYLQTIASWQQDGSTPINGANAQSQIQNIFGQIQAVDQQLGGSYFSYFSSQLPISDFVQQVEAKTNDLNNRFQDAVNSIDQRKNELEARRSEFEAMTNKLQDTLQIKTNEKEETIASMGKKAESLLESAQLLIGIGSGNKLADYYQRLANGRTIKLNIEHISRPRTTWSWLTKAIIRYVAIGAIVVALLVYATTMFFYYHPFTIDVWGTAAVFIFGITLFLFIATLAARSFIQLFDKYFPGGHARTAALWASGAILATLSIAVYSSFMIHEMKLNGAPNWWEFFVPKVLILLAPAYFVRLCVQNYRANAHLAVQYTHRATIMSIAENYSEKTALDYAADPEHQTVRIAAQAKMDILLEAARVMFAQSESGFITQKEGAGSGSDNMIDSINVGRMVK